MSNRPYKPGVALAALSLLALVGFVAVDSAQATTLQRMSVEKLATTNSTIVIGEVIDAYSYWNADGTFILTDVVIEKEAQLAGAPTKQNRLVLTLMGGEVDDLSVVVLNGAQLEIGKSYLLFASKSDLPGAPATMTVRDHSQGVFEIKAGATGGLRAMSQAHGGHLVADQNGEKSAPGGGEGLAFDQILSTIKSTLSSKAAGSEEK